MKKIYIIFAAACLLLLPMNAMGTTPAEPADVSMEAGSGGISPSEVGGIVAAVVVSLLTGGVLGRKSAVRIEPSPLTVEVSQSFVTRGEFETFRAKVAEDCGHLHGRIDALAPTVAEIKGKLEHISATQTTILKLLLGGKKAHE